jgi:hypothetical protein
MAYPSSWDFEDAFTISGGNVDPLGNHTPTVAGEAWSDAAGNNDNLIVDDTNDAVYHPGAGALQWNGSLAIHDSGAANNGWEDDHWAEGSYVAVEAGSNDHHVAVRCTLDGTSQIEGYGVTWSVNSWRVVRLDQTITSTDLDTYFDTTPSASDVVAIEAVGTTMSLYLNGSDVSSSPTADSTYTSGTPGIIGRKTGAAAQGIDEFRAAGVIAAGVGQPIVKRFGGVPGMAINRRIW